MAHAAAVGGSPAPEQHDLNLRHNIKWLRTLLQLFDEVLLEGYCKDHGSLALVDHASSEPACHFCGSCLFLSCFHCTGGCSNSERDFLSGNLSIFICSTCYVEGRTCGCGNMEPGRLSSFSQMLQDRNNALDVLSRSQVARGVQTQVPPQILEGCVSFSHRQNMTQSRNSDFSWPRVAVFQAANELWKLRKTSGADRVCVSP